MTMQDILDALEQNPDLQREFHKHVVDVIRNDDAIRQDLRKEILTEDLLLPARFTRLEEGVSQLRTDVNELRTDVNRISGQVDNVIEQSTLTLGQIANLTGSDYESQAIEQSRRIVRGQLNMESATVIFATRWDASEFEADVLVPAIREGRITRQRADQLEGTASIVRCEDQQGSVVCAVIAISVTVQADNRTRAAERVQIFSLATGWTTMPFVVGQEQEEAAPGSPAVSFLQYRP